MKSYCVGRRYAIAKSSGGRFGEVVRLGARRDASGRCRMMERGGSRLQG